MPEIDHISFKFRTGFHELFPPALRAEIPSPAPHQRVLYSLIEENHFTGPEEIPT